MKIRFGVLTLLSLSIIIISTQIVEAATFPVEVDFSGPAQGYFASITRAQMKDASLPGLWW